MRDEKGITLAALVLTVIILLIIASIATYSGIGTVRYAKYNKAKSEMQLMQSNVNSWYEEYKNVKVSAGLTEEETAAARTAAQQAVIDKYGVLTSHSSCDQTALTKTVNATGINANNYRFLSQDFVENSLGLNASFDFLINIPERDVILFNGVTYNGKTYYTVEDFDILNVKSIETDSISFNAAQGDNYSIIISDVKLVNSTDDTVSGLDISKFKVQYKGSTDTNWIDVTNSITKFTDEGDNKTKYKFAVQNFGNYEVRVSTIDNERYASNSVTVEKIDLRKGIEVGDYVTYIPPKNENAAEKIYSLSNNVSGYNSGTEQTLGQEYKTWRILNKNDDGSLDIIPAFYKADLPEGTEDFKAINFRDAKGYNNAVTILDDMCDYLYSYENKGITARSLDYDDIEKCMVEGKDDTQGLRKIRKYQKDKVANLTVNTSYSIAKDEKNNTVTYANGRSWYPNIYKTQEGAGINIYSKTGEEVSYGPGVWQKGEEREIEGNAIKAISESDKIALSTDNLKTQANNLTAKYTDYYGTIKYTDFENSTKHNVIFGTGTVYCLASRCVNCDSNRASFSLRGVDRSYLNAYSLFSSGGNANNGSSNRVCPVVHLGSDVTVTVSDTASTKDGTPHTVVIK